MLYIYVCVFFASSPLPNDVVPGARRSARSPIHLARNSLVALSYLVPVLVT